ncbi:MAG: PfkB family carbohydrate kinase [Patescibacteria group bacterium]|nr:PfkB family carbohydrate kinase [Patescibacteria group bacterium]
MSLLIVGSVAFDTVETPFGKIDNALGGSAVYFSLAAANFTKPSLVAVVGSDFTAKHHNALKRKGIDLSGLQKTKGQTFRWGGRYGFDVNNRETLFTHLNVFQNFQPELLPHHREKKYVFLGNIHPALQLQVLKQIKKTELVGLDTMNYWIEKNRPELLEVLSQADVFVINDSEARELAKEHNLQKAAKKILEMMGYPLAETGKFARNKTLIIKRGEYGLLMFRLPFSGKKIKGKNLQTFHLPGYPLEDVLDPTGAGDSFAGGLMGYLAKTENLSWDNLKKAAVYGSAAASFCVEKMGTKKLEEVKAFDIKRRFKEFKNLTHFAV